MIFDLLQEATELIQGITAEVVTLFQLCPDNDLPSRKVEQLQEEKFVHVNGALACADMSTSTESVIEGSDLTGSTAYVPPALRRLSLSKSTENRSQDRAYVPDAQSDQHECSRRREAPITSQMLLVRLDAERVRRYGLEPMRGILPNRPPGTGKKFSCQDRCL